MNSGKWWVWGKVNWGNMDSQRLNSSLASSNFWNAQLCSSYRSNSHLVSMILNWVSTRVNSSKLGTGGSIVLSTETLDLPFWLAILKVKQNREFLKYPVNCRLILVVVCWNLLVCRRLAILQTLSTCRNDRRWWVIQFIKVIWIVVVRIKACHIHKWIYWDIGKSGLTLNIQTINLSRGYNEDLFGRNAGKRTKWWEW